MPLGRKYPSKRSLIVRKGRDGNSLTRKQKCLRGPLRYIALLNELARTGTLNNILLCLKLSLIVLSLYGIVLLKQLKVPDALPLKMLNLLETVLGPKAYPILQTVLPDWGKS